MRFKHTMSVPDDVWEHFEGHTESMRNALRNEMHAGIKKNEAIESRLADKTRIQLQEELSVFSLDVRVKAVKGPFKGQSGLCKSDSPWPSQFRDGEYRVFVDWGTGGKERSYPVSNLEVDKPVKLVSTRER